MPNTGKPSRDCYRCRQRRIKCDLGQPECQRCRQSGQPCPGYRTELEIIFRNESQDSFPESSSRDRRKANLGSSWVVPSRTAPSAASKVDLNHMTAHMALFDKMTCGGGSPPPILSESWDDLAIPFVISLFSAPTKNGERYLGMMDFFPEMIAKAAETSPLIICCKAVAFMYLNNRYPAAAEGTSKRVAAYGRALSAIKTVLGDQDLCSRDENLVSIWLLSVYEILCGCNMSVHCPGRPITWNAHVLGLTSLLRTRTRPQFLSGSGRRFFWMVMGLVESRCLAAGDECPTEIYDWLIQHITDFVPEELDMHHTLVHGYHSSVVCANIRKVIDTGELQQGQSILGIIEEARKVGQETEASLAQDPLTRALRLRQAHIQNFHRAVRIHVQYSILELLQSSIARNDPELTPQFLEKQQNQSVSIVRALTQNTLATIPYILGSKGSTFTAESENEDVLERPRCWADGMRFLWPLRVIGSREVISKEQRGIVEESLQRLDTELCMRAAVMPYSIPKQMKLESLEQSKLPKGSKACKTCRRRKVKCDEEKPLCRRCRTARLDCEGYENPAGVFDSAQNLALHQGLIGRMDEST